MCSRPPKTAVPHEPEPAVRVLTAPAGAHKDGVALMGEVRTVEGLEEPAALLQGTVDFIASSLPDLFRRVDGETQITLARLISLLADEEIDDYGVPRPTLFALITALELIAGASLQMAAPLPRATPCTDDQGGLRFEWFRPACQLALVIPAHPGGRMYLYHAQGDEPGREDQVSASTLAHWLRQLEGNA